MARLELAPAVLDDFDHILDHLIEHGVEGAARRIDELLDALQVLTHSPLIGRPVPRLQADAPAGLRELVVGTRGRGDVALYRHVPTLDAVFVLAVRHQREAGYAQGDAH